MLDRLSRALLGEDADRGRDRQLTIRRQGGQLLP
jgi:hypothetical protein